jgi:hypothetical protein
LWGGPLTPVTNDVLGKERSRDNIRMELPQKRRVSCLNVDRKDALGVDSVDDLGALFDFVNVTG